MIRTKFPNKPFPNKSGIYLITSSVNGKRYVGSAASLRSRKNDHFSALKNRTHINRHLQNHVNKYGLDNLIFSIVEFCTKEKLIEREQYYINTLNPEFNICLIAGSSLGVKFSKKAKQKISEALKGKFTGKNNPMYGIHRFGKDAPNYGKHLSKETKLKISKAHLNKTISEETKRKISKSLKGREFSEETKKKLSASGKGRKHSEETKKRMKENHADFSGVNHPMYGKHLSKETKQKISESLKKYGKEKININ